MNTIASATPQPYDAFLLVSFGGPEGPDDVLPFLENVLRGKNVPRERMLEVAEHYQHFGGVSPINAQNRALLAALADAFSKAGISIPLYWGNRNWSPFLVDTVSSMATRGHRRVLAFFTSMFSCYSGCRQYRENLADACTQVGKDAPAIEKLRFGFNHPGFIRAMQDRVHEAAASLREETTATPLLLFTAHSIPGTMADHCDYEKQLREACRLVSADFPEHPWELVFQSRSGPPQQAWLEPDVLDFLTQHKGNRSHDLRAVILIPIGFISDHMEVMYDLDEEAMQACKELGIPMRRAGTVGTHPAFVEMIVSLVQERLDPHLARESLGELGPWHDVCPSNCCLYPRPATTGRPAAPGIRGGS